MSNKEKTIFMVKLTQQTLIAKYNLLRLSQEEDNQNFLML